MNPLHRLLVVVTRVVVRRRVPAGGVHNARIAVVPDCVLRLRPAQKEYQLLRTSCRSFPYFLTPSPVVTTM